MESIPSDHMPTLSTDQPDTNHVIETPIVSDDSAQVTSQTVNQSSDNEPVSAPVSKRSHQKKSGGSSRARAKSTSRSKPSTSNKPKSRPKKTSHSTISSTTRGQVAALEQVLASDNEDDDADMDDYVELPPDLSAREMEQEKQALAYRLLLKRPEFISRRRAQQAEARAKVDTQLTRWPYIDIRNVDMWTAEQQLRRPTPPNNQSTSSASDKQSLARTNSSSSYPVGSSPDAIKDAASESITNEQDVTIAASVNTDDDVPGPDDATDTSSCTPSTSASRPSTIARIPRVDDRRRRARQAMLQQTSTQCSSYPDAVFAAQSTDPFGLSCLQPNPFEPEFMIGSRCHMFDRVTNSYRDGSIVSFSPTRGHHIRLDSPKSDPPKSESARSKDSSLHRWILLHEEAVFWEIVDVAWSRNPDLKNKQKFWPCQIVHLYKYGVRSYSLDPASNQRSAPDYVLVHLLGYFDDFELHEVPTRLVFPFLHGLKSSWDSKLQNKAVQIGLENARWLYHFIASKWLKLENLRRHTACQKLCDVFRREGPGPFIGKRVSCLWKEDAMWYAGTITQFNALTQSFCVVYDDHELEWISLTRNVFSLDSFPLPVTIDLDEDQPYPNVDVCYFDFRMYADDPPPVTDVAAWYNRMDAIRKHQAAIASPSDVPSVMPDPALGQQGQECWECGLVDDVFLLSAMRGVEKNRSDNISCQRCNKICHPRCYSLMRDRLEHGKHNDSAHVDDLMLDTEIGNHRRGDADEGGQRWTVVIDKSKPPRCVDCLKCEHCNLFGAKSLKPEVIEEDAPSDTRVSSADGSQQSPPHSPSPSPPKDEYVILRAPVDLLTCDVCNIRVHRQCLEPPFNKTMSKLVGGWVCRACLACRSCLTTQSQFEHDAADPRTIASSSISMLSNYDHLMEDADSADESYKTREKAKVNKVTRDREKKSEMDVNDPLTSILQALEDGEDDTEDGDSSSSPSSTSVNDAEAGDRSCMSTPPAGEIPAEIIGQLVRDILTNIITNITDTVDQQNNVSVAMDIDSTVSSEPVVNDLDFAVEQLEIPQSSLSSLALSTTSIKPVVDMLVSPLPAEPVLLSGIEGAFWELWRYEFTMCNSCADRMTAREYCVTCCGLWDHHGMVQCGRCVRWVHIECDESARNTESDRLNDDGVNYYCPDCVKREKANEMIAILDVLNTQDRNHYFLKPVTAEDAPEYFDTIKTPMDFTTIYNKLYSMSYKTLEQFKYDLNLVWRNAKDYNPSTSIVYKTAVRLQQRSVELLEILRIKTGDTELEQEEGRIEDKHARPDKLSNQPLPASSSSVTKPVDVVPDTPLQVELSLDQQQREQLMIVAVEPFRFFHPPDAMGDLFMHIDICNVCGAAGDHEHFLACSDCGDMFHWFCLDIDMLRRAYRDPVQTGGPAVAVADFESLNNERLSGQWKCHNCAVCSLCSHATRLRTLETKQVQRKVDRDREREEFGEEQTASYTVQVVSETVVQQPIVDCDLCDRTFHIDCLGEKFKESPSLGPDFPPAPYRCDRCVYCLFCGTTRPGSKKGDQWQLGYTACTPCAKRWRDGKSCPVCQKLWAKSTSTPSLNSSVKSETDLLVANGHDFVDQHENDSMQCQLCRKWAHLACDPAITQAEYELLGDSNFDYYCPTCRLASHDLAQEFEEQHQELRQQMRRKLTHEHAKQDFTNLLFPPFAKGVDAVARFCSLYDPVARPINTDQITSNIFSTIFSATVDVDMLEQLKHWSTRQILEATKQFVHRTQTLRRRQRRKWLVQQKRVARADLPLADRCAPWLDENSSADQDTLALVDKMLRELLIVYKREPTQSRHLLPRILAVMDPYTPRPNSPGPGVRQLEMSTDSSEQQPKSEHAMLDDQPPLLETVNHVKSEYSLSHANGVVSANGDHSTDSQHIDHPDHLSHPHDSSANSTIKHEPGMLIPASRRQRPHHPLPIPAFTFEGQLATDFRVCFLCNKHGDQEEHLDSSGRLLPADPFTPALSYVHIHCALWASAMHGSTSEQGAMSGVFTAYHKHHRQQCDHCGELVASIGCRSSKCKKFFHFDCAIAADCIFTADTKVYCAEHAANTRGLVEHNLVPVQRAMFVKTSTYDVTDGKLKMRHTLEMRHSQSTVEGKQKLKLSYKRKKTKATSSWQEKKPKKQKVSSPTTSQADTTTTAGADFEDGEIDTRGSPLEEGEIEPDDDDDDSKSGHADSVNVKNELDTSSSPSLEHPSNQVTVSSTLYHQRLGALTIITLGSVNPSPGFHTSHFIYPVGFHAYRMFWSYMKKYRRVGYHLHIDNRNDAPLFRIIADDDVTHPIESNDPAAAYTRLMKRVQSTLGSTHRVTSPMTNAAWLFGYGMPAIVEQLEYADGAGMLSLPEYEFGYNARRMEVRKSDLADLEMERVIKLYNEQAVQAALDVEVPRHRSSCVRLEPYAGKRPWSAKVNYKVGFGFNKPLLPSGPASAVSFSSSNLAATVELASDKRRKVGQVEATAGHVSANAMSAAALTHAYRAMKTSVMPRAVVGHSVIHEWGLFAASPLEPNTMVVEYLGESIRQKVADMREKRYEETGIGSCYMFRIDSDMIIDATKRGNIGRFINHSCDPNCVTRIIDVNGVKKIAVITNRKVTLGEEITYDYFFANEADRIACNCGARNCAGRLN